MRESNQHIERQAIFYCPFLSEQDVLRQGGVPTSVTFSQGKAIFDGSSLIYTENIILDPVVGFSVRIICTSNDLASNQHLFSKATGGNTEFILTLNSNNFMFFVGSGAGGSQALIPLPSTDIYDVVGIWDGTDTKIYANGIEGADAGVPVTPVPIIAPLTIGRAAGGGNAWDGAMDLAEIYNYPLTAPEIYNLAN